MKRHHRILSFFLFLGLTAFAPRARAGVFGDNTTEDIFTVKALAASEATLEGTPKSLKSGDFLYFVRSPFKFRVTEVKGNQVKIAVPDKSDLKVGNTLMRKENEQIRRAMDTENRLKQALEE